VITEQQLVGLIQRADWTRLSLSATVSRRFNRALRDEQLRSMPPPPWLPPWARAMMDLDDMPLALGDHVTGSLIIAPGCRFREELTDESGDTAVSGCDGDRAWLVNPRLSATETNAGDRRGQSGWRSYAYGSPHPPFSRLLSPSWLLKGSELRIEGAATAAEREAWHIVAILEARGPGGFGPHRYDLIVDAELGILLRCENFVRGLPLSVEELDAVRIQPPEAMDESRFAAPPDALKDWRHDFVKEPMPPGLATAAGLAADALGFAIRHGPGSPRRPSADGGGPMPHDADDVDQENWPPVSDETAYLLYRGLSAEHDIAAELDEWFSIEGLADGLRRGGRAFGQGGVGRLADAISEKAVAGSMHQVARVVLAADGVRYRLDWVAGAPRRRPVTEACDGQTSWRVYPDRTLTGSVRPVPSRIADLVHSSWLLEWRLADGGVEIVDGRRGYRVRATRVQGATLGSRLLIYGAAVAVIDAELGVITRLTSYAAGIPTARWELRDVRVPVSTSAADFRVTTPPGGRVEQETGPFDEAPEPVRQVVRTAEQIGRVVGPVVTRAAEFLSSLKSRSDKG
jgi:outer membrane lipoprotein-sorting protein